MKTSIATAAWVGAVLSRACASLRIGGQLWAVANRQLPYERTLYEAAGEVHVVAQEKGFKVLMARKGG